MPKTKSKKPKIRKYSISVTGTTYARIRAAVPRGDMASFVDDVLVAALDDPAIAAGVVTQCRRGEGYS
jgi:hypothetical protein